jgi:hypothetical protein
MCDAFTHLEGAWFVLQGTRLVGSGQLVGHELQGGGVAATPQRRQLACQPRHLPPQHLRIPLQRQVAQRLSNTSQRSLQVRMLCDTCYSHD